MTSTEYGLLDIYRNAREAYDKQAYFDYIVYDERKPYAFIKYFLKKGWKGLKTPEQVNQELLQ